jgi:hypothetical protein
MTRRCLTYESWGSRRLATDIAHSNEIVCPYAQAGLLHATRHLLHRESNSLRVQVGRFVLYSQQTAHMSRLRRRGYTKKVHGHTDADNSHGHRTLPATNHEYQFHVPSPPKDNRKFNTHTQRQTFQHRPLSPGSHARDPVCLHPSPTRRRPSQAPIVTCQAPTLLTCLYKPSSPPPQTRSASKCKGISRSGEDTSELGFLLVENYNYDCSRWPSWSAGNFYNKLFGDVFIGLHGAGCGLEEECRGAELTHRHTKLEW